MKRKINLISTLVHRALVICLESTLHNEICNIRRILINNGYSEVVINTSITKKMNQFRRPTQFGPTKRPVYLHLPWLGSVSMRYEMQIKTVVKRCYFAVEPRIVYTTSQLLPEAKKDVQYYSLHIKATLLINLFATVIVGIWVVLLKGYNKRSRSTYLKPFFRDILLKTEAHSLALANQSEALNLKLFSSLQSNICYKTRRVYVNKMMENCLFLARGRTSFHLSILEATCIKTSKPNFCKQKEFVCGLKIAH